MVAPTVLTQGRRNWGGAGGVNFGRSVKPFLTKETDYAHYNTIIANPWIFRFSAGSVNAPHALKIPTALRQHLCRGRVMRKV